MPAGHWRCTIWGPKEGFIKQSFMPTVLIMQHRPACCIAEWQSRLCRRLEDAFGCICSPRTSRGKVLIPEINHPPGKAPSRMRLGLFQSHRASLSRESMSNTGLDTFQRQTRCH